MASKALNLTLGILFILLAVLMFIFPGATLWVIIVVASIFLMIIGISTLIEAFENKEEMDKLTRLISIILGIVLTVLAITLFIAAFISENSGFILFTVLLGIDFLLMGAFRIYAGVINKELVSWFRVLILVIGVIMVVLGILIFISPIIGGIIVLFVVAIAFIVAGALRIILAFKEPEK